jgi:hypothetical protein
MFDFDDFDDDSNLDIPWSFFEDEDLENALFLKEQCRAIRTMSVSELLAEEKNIRKWIEGQLASITDPEEPETDTSDLDYFMEIYRAIERRAKKLNVVLPRWEQKTGLRIQ